MPVPPLALPDARALPPVEELAAIASVALFVFRARSVDPTFVLSVSNARAVADICARLDGLPLAIELAAAPLKHFTPADLAARLEQRLVLLVDGPRDAPRRQRTLRDALSWSYDLLAADEQRLFRALSVCAGGADPATIANQWTAIGGAGDPLPLARSLLDKSLLTRAFVRPEGLRVTMLETVHEFAQHQLVAHGEHPRAARAHADHFLALAEDAHSRWETPDAPTWLDRVEREHANLRAAFTWFVDHHQPDAAMRLAASLAWFWRTRGYANEGHDHLETALALDPSGSSTVVRARALHQAGELARILALYDVAEERLTQALAAFRAFGDRRAVALTLDLLAATARFQGHYAAARIFLVEALPIARELGEPSVIRKCLISLGALATNQGDLNAAPPWLEEALALARHEGDLVGQVQALCYLGIVATELGAFMEAGRRLQLAVDANQRLGDLDYWATLFDALAGLAGARGEFRRALCLIGAADRVLHDVGTRSLPPIRQARRDTWLRSANAALGQQAADVARREGESLELDEAVALALGAVNPNESFTHAADDVVPSSGPPPGKPC